jgi:hypothetical protein
MLVAHQMMPSLRWLQRAQQQQVLLRLLLVVLPALLVQVLPALLALQVWQSASLVLRMGQMLAAAAAVGTACQVQACMYNTQYPARSQSTRQTCWQQCQACLPGSRGNRLRKQDKLKESRKSLTYAAAAAAVMNGVLCTSN